MNPDRKVRVLELYSGIGGMHFAIKESGIEFEVVGAADINTVANEIYLHNFPQTKVLTKCIEAMSIDEFNKLDADMILMSPPCQPFTRVGKQKDAEDQRTKSFFHLMDSLSSFKKIPRYILVENVKGFDTSLTREKLLKTLIKCQYTYQEFLLSPLQFGIPNSRLRYYLIAKREGDFCFQLTSEIMHTIPEPGIPYLKHRLKSNVQESDKIVHKEHHSNCKESSIQTGCKKCGEDSQHHAKSLSDNTCNWGAKSSSRQPSGNMGDCKSACEGQGDSAVTDAQVTREGGKVSEDCCDRDRTVCGHQAGDQETDNTEIPMYERFKHLCRPISTFMEHESDDYFKPYLLQEKFFRRFWVMDIVHPYMRNTCCFTKRYAHHMEGSGSILQMNTDSQVDLSAYKRERVYTDEVHEGVRSIKLRYFTPREIANLMCFPPEFSFPDGLTPKQCYRVMGNSLNVHVVAVLLHLLTSS